MGFMGKLSPYSTLIEARFWAKVRIPEAPQCAKMCWEWTGSLAKGYGQMKVDGEVLRTHRIAYEIENGPLEDGEHVLHSCDNPLCANPAHLRAGTHDENMDDKRIRGRAWKHGPRTRAQVIAAMDIFG
jgi:hypothetical protein